REARLLAFSSDGTLASVGRDREILLWDRKAEHVRQTLTSDRERITSLAFSPDGGTLASGGSDGAVVLWDVATGRSLRPLVGHQGEVTCVAVGPLGKVVVSGGRDRKILLWDAASGASTTLIEWPKHTSEPSSVSVSPDGTIVAWGSRDSAVPSFWSAAANNRTPPSEDLPRFGGVTRVAVSPNGQTPAAAAGGGVVLWDVRSLKPVGLCAQESWSSFSLGEGRVAFFPEGKRIAVWSSHHAERIAECTIDTPQVASR